MGCTASSPVAASNDSKPQSQTTYRVLVLRNAVTGADSFSNKGVDKVIALLKAESPSITVVERDLVKNPIAFFGEAEHLALYKGEQNTPEQKALAKKSDELIAEIKSVDLVLVGLPRYNFGYPVSFKNYLDNIIRPKVTFQYGANGPEGLLPNTPVFFVLSAGGVYGEDYYCDWLKTVMGFIGMKDLTFLPVEGTGMGKADEALAGLADAASAAIKKIKEEKKL